MLDQSEVSLLTEMRRTLHANPEVSEHEHNTQIRILDFLAEHTSAQLHKVANTGVLAVFDSKKPGSSIMVRGDIDALPIQEINTFSHRSKTDGVSHKCGHDGHTCILMGLAILLTKNPLKKGRAILLFQPAEENGMGAQAVLDDSVFKEQSIDYVIALHNLPGYKKHEIVLRRNEFNANVKSIIVKLNGKTAHAAEPELGKNPAKAISDILQFSNENTFNQPESDDFFLITPVFVNLGDKAYGISAGYGEVHLTIRSWSTTLMKKKCSELESFIEQKCDAEGLIPEISWTQVFYANINDSYVVDMIQSAAKQRGYSITEREYPFKWGEDFGLFTQKFKGAMFGIGAGIDSPALHNPDYDFPDEIITTGANMFYQIIHQIQ